MTDDNDSISNNNRPKNLVQFESAEVKHKFGLDKYPDIPTEQLIVIAKKILLSIDPPFQCRQSDIQFMAYQYWCQMCVDELGMRINALNNQIDK